VGGDAPAAAGHCHHVLESTMATPSGWRPGKVTLKPGPDLVGNVWKTSMAFV